MYNIIANSKQNMNRIFYEYFMKWFYIMEVIWKRNAVTALFSKGEKICHCSLEHTPERESKREHTRVTVS